MGIESRPQLDTSDCGHENDKRRQERAIYTKQWKITGTTKWEKYEKAVGD